MKIIFLIALLFYSPVKEVENIVLALPAAQQRIFLNYSNDNFSQRIRVGRTKVTAYLKSSNYLDLNLNFRIFMDYGYLKKQNLRLRSLALDLFDKSNSLKALFANISVFLKKNISYSDNPYLLQDADSVLLNKKANCIGYSNLVEHLLSGVGIKIKQIKGFYLDKNKGRRFTPIPHRWLEIYLLDKTTFFYDPQYQNFKANYIVVKKDVDFRKIKKFKVVIIKKLTEFLN